MSFENKKEYWPVYTGKSFDIWNPDRGRDTYYASANPDKVITFLQNKRYGARNNPKSAHSEFSVEYLSNVDTLPCYKPRIAFRDVTGYHARRTVIACLIPPKVFITNTGPYFLWPHGDEKDQAYLLGILCSIPLDWYARRFVELHMSFYIVNSLPIPRPEGGPLHQRVIELAGRLACPDKRFAKWAKAVGVQHGRLPEDEKEDMVRELDAVVAHLYGLTEKQLVHIFETFHEGWDYQARLNETLKHYRTWKERTENPRKGRGRK